MVSSSTEGYANKTLELHTENIPKELNKIGRPKKQSDRMKTSVYISKDIQKGFIDACKVSGHNECSVDESLKSAFTQAVKRSILGQPVEEYPFKSISIRIDVLNITPKYDQRGVKPKPKEEYSKIELDLIRCPKSAKWTYADGNHEFTCMDCNYGGKWKKARGEPCKVYEKVKYHA